MWLEILNLFATPSSVSVSFCRVRFPSQDLAFPRIFPRVASHLSYAYLYFPLLCFFLATTIVVFRSCSRPRLARDLNLLSEILSKSFMLEWASSFKGPLCVLVWARAEATRTPRTPLIDKHEEVTEKELKSRQR